MCIFVCYQRNLLENHPCWKMHKEKEGGKSFRIKFWLKLVESCGVNAKWYSPGDSVKLGRIKIWKFKFPGWGPAGKPSSTVQYTCHTKGNNETIFKHGIMFYNTMIINRLGDNDQLLYSNLHAVDKWTICTKQTIVCRKTNG